MLVPGLKEAQRKAQDASITAGKTQAALLRKQHEFSKQEEAATDVFDSLEPGAKEYELSKIAKERANIEPGSALDTDLALPEGAQKTKKQIAGEAAQVLLDTLAAGTYGAAAKGAKTGQVLSKAPTAVSGVIGAGQKGGGVVKGALRGAAKGAQYGGAFGAAQGAVSGLKEDEDALGVLGSTLEGGAAGAALGGVIGGIGGGIAGKAQGALTSPRDRAIAAIVPKPEDMTNAQYREAISQGKLLPKTLIHGPSLAPGKETELAAKFEHLLQSKDPVKNMGNVMDEIINHDRAVGEYLKGKKIIYSDGELRNALRANLDLVDDIQVDEVRLDKYKDKLVAKFIERLEKNDLEHLWMTRKDWDQWAENELRAFEGTPTLRKNLVKAIRNGAQEFITDRLGNNVYADHMTEMRQLFSVKDLIEDKALTEKGRSALGAWAKSHPAAAKAVKWTLIGLGGAVAGTFLGKKGIDVAHGALE